MRTANKAMTSSMYTFAVIAPVKSAVRVDFISITPVMTPEYHARNIAQDSRRRSGVTLRTNVQSCWCQPQPVCEKPVVAGMCDTNWYRFCFSPKSNFSPGMVLYISRQHISEVCPDFTEFLHKQNTALIVEPYTDTRL